MTMRKRYYLVGNAHLDPVWLWQWQEGSAEAKATIRSALDRMKEFPEFRFVCSSASIYRWVEEFAPEMFEEIKARVAEGRIIVVGGWHVQPDCNMPSGEAYARQSLYSQRYFMEKLGVTAKVGYDVDSFGHNYMLPQILKKSGMDSYIWMRPGHHEKDIPHDVFEWVSPDGSSVTACHIADGYGFNFNTLEEFEQRCAFIADTERSELDAAALFYGVGNHGGGPTIRNLEVMREFRKKHPDVELVYSDVHDYFEDVRSCGTEIPKYYEDLQHHASGCYATVPRIKTGVRRSERELIAAESFNMLAGTLCGKAAQNETLAEAWRNVCFCHFHDSLDGCSIKEVYDDADQMLGYARHVAAVTENNALQTISWAVDTSDKSLGLPVFVFNPHSFEVEQMVRVNKQFTCVKDADGNVVPSQWVMASAHTTTWGYNTLFKARVPALGYAVYYLCSSSDIDLAHAIVMPEEEKEAAAESSVKAIAFEGKCTANEHGGTMLENERWSIRFEQYSGYITSFVDKRTGKEIISDRAAVPVVIDEYYHDTWSHARNFFTDQMARFSDAEVTVVENGPVRATVKVVSRYNKSTLTQYFSLGAGEDKLRVRAKVDWYEKFKMLKISWPMAVENPRAFYEIPYGVIERPADGEEEPGQTWTAVKGDNACFAIVNNNTYSSSVRDGTIYHTILRSPIYADHGGPRTDESEVTAQGRTDFAYVLMPVEGDWTDAVKEGIMLNKPLTNIIENWHEGKIDAKIRGGLKIDADNVIMSALKRSEDGMGLILRVYEVAGRETAFTACGDVLPKALSATVTPWSVQTWYLADGSDTWKEVLLTEYEA